MKPYYLIPAVSAAGGFAAFLLRLVQNRTGFDSLSGLPVPGAPAGTALLIFLIVLCLLIALLCRTLPDENRASFSTENRLFLTLPVMGSLLFAAAGAADLLEALSSNGSVYFSPTSGNLLGVGGVDMSRGVLFLCGLLSLATAAGLLSVCAACLHDDGLETRGAALLLPPVCLVVRLVAVYRVESVNPVLEDYAPELLALTFLVLGFYTLSAFPFHAGKTRRFALCAACGTAFALCALADRPEHLSAPLLCAGGALCLLGFLMLNIQSLEIQAG